jgi:hypothetical protein
MLRHCLAALLAASLLALPVRAEQITLTVHGNTSPGTLPTFLEPSAFFGWTSPPMKQQFGVDAGVSSGLIVESTQLLLGPPTSLANYQLRLEQSGLATEAALASAAGVQFLLQVHGMPRWIWSSSVISTPPGCEEEWPKYQTVAPDPAKWAEWEAAIADGDLLQRHTRARQRLVPVLGGTGRAVLRRTPARPTSTSRTSTRWPAPRPRDQLEVSRLGGGERHPAGEAVQAAGRQRAGETEGARSCARRRDGRHASDRAHRLRHPVRRARTCGATAFGSCRTTGNASTVRCP